MSKRRKKRSKKPKQKSTAKINENIFIIPTELIFVHTSILLPLVSTIFITWSKYTLINFVYFAVSIITYWLIRIKLRKSGLLKKWWDIQVLDIKRHRVSSGVILSILEHFNIIIAFIGVFLFLVNLLSFFQSDKTWIECLYMGLSSFNIKGFDDFLKPNNTVSRFICALLSFLSILFTGLLTLIFLKPFLIVFCHK